MKDCLIIGPGTVMMYKDVYPLLIYKVLKIGVWTVGWETEKGHNIGYWFTTLQVNKPENKKLKPTKTYNENDYPRFDNAPDIIESNSRNVPVDYQGEMGVPISFLKYYPDMDYEILEKRGDLVLNGKQLFERLIIRRKQL